MFAFYSIFVPSTYSTSRLTNPFADNRSTIWDLGEDVADLLLDTIAKPVDGNEIRLRTAG